MASVSTLTTQAPSEVSHRLDNKQTLKASSALLAHIKRSKQKQSASKSKAPNLLADPDELLEHGANTDTTDPVPIWLCLTTKHHIVDKARLKPILITVPHALSRFSDDPLASTGSICLITADPQRSVKDLIASPTFPAALRARIGRVLGISKLRAKYKSFESRRQLQAEHSIFLADDRIAPDLLGALGKTFFKTTAKRPIPVRISPSSGTMKKMLDDKQKARKADAFAPKKRRDTTSETGSLALGNPEGVAVQINKALDAAVLYLSASVATSVRIGFADWSAKQVAENVEAVVTALTEKSVPKGWKGVRAIHIKGPNTAALPIWLADELWVEKEVDVVEAGEKQKALEDGAKKAAAKRKEQKRLRDTDTTHVQAKRIKSVVGVVKQG
ncbi:MAG: hypothetical protein M1814_004823 [Vezdaea aestivalis]|nr:MAG: hypothetical protein M1814_004823 [Vezdaea aestivalis]